MEKAMAVSTGADRVISFSETTEGMAAGFWHVPTAGFRWVDDAQPMQDLLNESELSDDGPWLVPKSNDGRRYPVLRRPGLLEAMDRLSADPTTANILTFANRWGGLGDEQLIAIPFVDAEGAVAGHRGIESGESLLTWREHLMLYGDLRRLWRAICVAREPDSWSDAVVHEAQARLRSSVIWTADGSCVCTAAGLRQQTPGPSGRGTSSM